MDKFIYVFSREDYNTLLKAGYRLLKSNDAKNIYVFENQQQLHFDLNTVNAVSSSVLTF